MGSEERFFRESSSLPSASLFESRVKSDGQECPSHTSIALVRVLSHKRKSAAGGLRRGAPQYLKMDGLKREKRGPEAALLLFLLLYLFYQVGRGKVERTHGLFLLANVWLGGNVVGLGA